MVASAAQSGFDEEPAEFVAVEPEGRGLVVLLRSAHMGGGVEVEEAFFGAVGGEPADRRQPTPDRRRREPFGFGPAGVQLDVGALGVEHRDVGGVEPVDELLEIDSVRRHKVAPG